MERYNFIIFGDSITYGAWDKEKGGWVNRLRMAYENNGLDNRYNMFNLGISGEIVEEISHRFNAECSSRFKEDQTNMIILSCGINDSQIDNNEDRTPPELFETQYEVLIQKALKFTNNILIIGLTCVDETKVCPIPWHLEKYYYNHKVREYNDIIEKLASKYHLQFLDVYHLLQLEDLSDGLHPNEVGHQKMCDVIKEKIDTIFML